MLNFNIYLNHHTNNFTKQLTKTYPKNINIYYKNINNKIFNTILPLLNTSTHIPIYKLINNYNTTKLPPNPNHLPLLITTILKKHIHLQNFIITQNYNHHIHKFQKKIKQ